MYNHNKAQQSKNRVHISWDILYCGFVSVCVTESSEKQNHVDGFVQDCSNSIANALEILQSCTKPSIWYYFVLWNGIKKMRYPTGYDYGTTRID